MSVDREVCVGALKTRTEDLKPISEAKRFGILVAGAFGCICVSLSFGFNIFSNDLQQLYHLTQADMTTISTVGIVFAYFGMPYAFVYDYFGVLPVLILGLILITLGALLMALTFGGYITATVGRLCVFNAIFNFGTGVYDLACVVTVLSIFPTHKGVIVAVMKTFIGLGFAIISAIQLAYFEGKPTNYFYFLMAFGLVVGTLLVFVMRQPPYILSDYEQQHLSYETAAARHATRTVYLRQKPPSLRFAIGFVFVVLLIIFLPLQGALLAYLDLSWGYRNAFAIVTILLLAAYTLIALPIPWLNQDWLIWRRCCKDKAKSHEPVPLDVDGKWNSDQPNGNAESDASGVLLETDYVAPQYQTRFLQSVCTLKLWGIFWTLFCTIGTEFVVMNNSRYLFAALSGEAVDDSLNSLLTVMNGVGSAVGRLLMSYFEIWSQKRKPEDRIPITISLFLPSVSVIVMIVLFLTLRTKQTLPLPYVLGALGNGFCAAVTILVINTIYARDAGLHYNFCFFATTCSSIVLNRVLYGEWYTREANKRGVDVCFDRGCVQLPLLVMLGLNVSAFVSDAYVHWEYVKLIRRAMEERRALRAHQLEDKTHEDQTEDLLLLDEVEGFTTPRKGCPNCSHITEDVLAASKLGNTTADGKVAREGWRRADMEEDELSDCVTGDVTKGE